jgi:hypothetical protein
MTFAGPNWDRLDPGLVQYLEDHQGSADYLVATQTSSYASLFILASRQPAMALGGYQGWDRILTPAELEQLIADGAVRFFYLSTVQNTRGFGAANANLDATADLTAWVVNACTVVPPSTWQSSPTTSPTAGGLQLYDCAPAVQRSQSQ